LKAAYKTLAEGLIRSKERSELPRQQSNKQKTDQTITIINSDALNKIRAPLDRLKNLCSPALAKALTAGAPLPEAVLKSNQPQPSAQELEATYKTLAEGLIRSKERSELARQQSNKQKSDQTITIINTDALNKIRSPLDKLKNLCSPALVRALTAGARLAACKTLAEGLIRSKGRSELPRQQSKRQKPDQTITIINTDALNKIRVHLDRLKNLCSPALAKVSMAGVRLPPQAASTRELRS
jgi:predicted small metal-binding protein